MPSVSCKIRSTPHPARWVELEIGVDGSGENFWRLTARSNVGFPQFDATAGRWDPIPYYGGSPSGGYWGLPSIALIAADPDPLGGIVLFRPGPAFYRLGCGRVIRDEGSREGVADLTYRMDFLCT